jgi:hypothetical protein
MSSSGARLERASSGVPHSGQKERVSVAPELAGRAKDLAVPVRVTSAGRASTTAEWPVPVARWQSSQEHRNIARTLPENVMETAPQAHLVVTSTTGRGLPFMITEAASPLVRPQAG